MNFDVDNLLAITLLGAIAITAMVTQAQESSVVTSIASGLIGYLAKGMIKK